MLLEVHYKCIRIIFLKWKEYSLVDNFTCYEHLECFQSKAKKTQQIRICNFLKLGTFMFIIHPYFIIYESSIYFTHFSISFFYIVLTVYRHTLYILEAVLCWLNMFSYLLLVFSKCFRKAILLHFLLHVNLRLSLPILT